VKIRLVDDEDIRNLIYEKFWAPQKLHQEENLFMLVIRRNQSTGRTELSE
jgi:hypothetical protein